MNDNERTHLEQEMAKLAKESAAEARRRMGIEPENTEFISTQEPVVENQVVTTTESTADLTVVHNGFSSMTKVEIGTFFATADVTALRAFFEQEEPSTIRGDMSEAEYIGRELSKLSGTERGSFSISGFRSEFMAPLRSRSFLMTFYKQSSKRFAEVSKYDKGALHCLVEHSKHYSKSGITRFSFLGTANSTNQNSTFEQMLKATDMSAESANKTTDMSAQAGSDVHKK